MTETAEQSKQTQRKKCIFCGQRANSEEHIAPQWARDHTGEAPSHERFWNHSSGTEPQKVVKNYKRQGSAKTARLKTVCTTCNNGWMSRFEEEVRPLLTDLMEAKERTFDVAEQTKLAQYMTLKCMVIDGDDPMPTFTDIQYDMFMKSRTIPEHFSIHICRNASQTWKSGFHPQSLEILPKNSKVERVIVKCFSIGLGSLFVYGLNSPEFDIPSKLDFQFLPQFSARLSPIAEQDLKWPPEYAIDLRWCDKIAFALDRFRQSGLCSITPWQK